MSGVVHQTAEGLELQMQLPKNCGEGQLTREAVRLTLHRNAMVNEPDCPAPSILPEGCWCSYSQSPIV